MSDYPLTSESLVKLFTVIYNNFEARMNRLSQAVKLVHNKDKSDAARQIEQEYADKISLLKHNMLEYSDTVRYLLAKFDAGEISKEDKKIFDDLVSRYVNRFDEIANTDYFMEDNPLSTEKKDKYFYIRILDALSDDAHNIEYSDSVFHSVVKELKLILERYSVMDNGNINDEIVKIIENVHADFHNNSNDFGKYKSMLEHVKASYIAKHEILLKKIKEEQKKLAEVYNGFMTISPVFKMYEQQYREYKEEKESLGQVVSHDGTFDIHNRVSSVSYIDNLEKINLLSQELSEKGFIPAEHAKHIKRLKKYKSSMHARIINHAHNDFDCHKIDSKELEEFKRKSSWYKDKQLKKTFDLLLSKSKAVYYVDRKKGSEFLDELGHLLSMKSPNKKMLMHTLSSLHKGVSKVSDDIIQVMSVPVTIGEDETTYDRFISEQKKCSLRVDEKLEHGRNLIHLLAAQSSKDSDKINRELSAVKSKDSVDFKIADIALEIEDEKLRKIFLDAMNNFVSKKPFNNEHMLIILDSLSEAKRLLLISDPENNFISKYIKKLDGLSKSNAELGDVAGTVEHMFLVAQYLKETKVEHKHTKKEYSSTLLNILNLAKPEKPLWKYWSRRKQLDALKLSNDSIRYFEEQYKKQKIELEHKSLENHQSAAARSVQFNSASVPISGAGSGAGAGLVPRDVLPKNTSTVDDRITSHRVSSSTPPPLLSGKKSGEELSKSVRYTIQLKDNFESSSSYEDYERLRKNVGFDSIANNISDRIFCEFDNLLGRYTELERKDLHKYLEKDDAEKLLLDIMRFAKLIDRYSESGEMPNSDKYKNYLRFMHDFAVGSVFEDRTNKVLSLKQMYWDILDNYKLPINYKAMYRKLNPYDTGWHIGRGYYKKKVKEYYNSINAIFLDTQRQIKTVPVTREKVSVDPVPKRSVRTRQSSENPPPPLLSGRVVSIEETKAKKNQLEQLEKFKTSGSYKDYIVLKKNNSIADFRSMLPSSQMFTVIDEIFRNNAELKSESGKVSAEKLALDIFRLTESISLLDVDNDDSRYYYNLYTRFINDLLIDRRLESKDGTVHGLKYVFETLLEEHDVSPKKLYKMAHPRDKGWHLYGFYKHKFNKTLKKLKRVDLDSTKRYKPYAYIKGPAI